MRVEDMNSTEKMIIGAFVALVAISLGSVILAAFSIMMCAGLPV